ncbi:head-tail connector protein [Aestuariibius sp. 2305UL40-4]|uniref:head-tail connector protein n=1 Tax=Aestuariibius violaceus TaxID=3234132 RepID=UPI00345F0C9D
MTRVSLESVKRGLPGFPVDFADDDAKLTDLIEAAEAHIADYLRRDLDADWPVDLPAPIAQSVRLLVGLWYDHGGLPEFEADGHVPATVKTLLASYRDLS